MQERFQALLDEESKGIHLHNHLAVIIARDESLPPKFEFRGGPKSPYFQERYKQVATDAGLLLGKIPEGFKPIEFWFQSLVAFWLSKNKAYLGTVVTAHEESVSTQTIHSVCEASAAYCTSLDVRSIDEATLGSSGELHRAVTAAFSKIEPEMLRSCRSGLDNQLQLIADESDRHPDHLVSDELWEAVKTAMDDVSALVGFPGGFQRPRSPEVLKSQVHAIRQKVEARLLESESKLIHPHVDSSQTSTITGSPSKTPNTFPNRAHWLRVRLQERGWDRNDVHRCSGPDVKTVQKILDGTFVRVGAFGKLLIALNHKKVGKTLTFLDIPSD